MKRIFSLLLVAMLALFTAVSCKGDTPMPGTGTGESVTPDSGGEPGLGGYDGSPNEPGEFEGIWQAVKKEAFQDFEDTIYFSFSSNGLIIYVPTKGSTSCLPYVISVSGVGGYPVITVTEGSFMFQIIALRIGENYNFILAERPAILSSLADGVIQVKKGADLDSITPDMPGQPENPENPENPETPETPDAPEIPDDPTNLLYIKNLDGVITVVYCDWDAPDAVIPYGVEAIGDRAFRQCWAMSQVVIPESVTKIGKSVFSGCRNLYSITIPDSVVEISTGAFSSSSLKNISLPESLRDIYNNGDNDWSIPSGCIVTFREATSV